MTTRIRRVRNSASAPWLNWIEQPPPKGQVIGSNPIGVANLPGLGCVLPFQLFTIKSDSIAPSACKSALEFEAPNFFNSFAR